jgi:class 3 adenylate cyclase/HAMP domain-containing protein
MTSARSSTGKKSGVSAVVQVTTFMIAVALVSVFAVGIYNLVSARNVLQGVSKDQLSDVAASNIDSVAGRFDAKEDLATVLAADRGVVSALVDFDAAYSDLPSTVDAQNDIELLAAYELELLDAPSAEDDPPPADLIPESAQARYLQYWYIAQSPDVDRSLLDRADDGSTYSEVHAKYHPTLRSIAALSDLGDLILVNLDGTVVYSVDKNIDVGTNLVDGPYMDSVLAQAAMEVGPDTGAGESGSADLEFYAPAIYAPTSFIVSPVSDGESVVGYLLAEVRAATLTDLVTNDSDWVDAGLGETGEIYLVGDDLTLRTDSRLWLEDPETFLDETSKVNGDVVAQDVDTRQTSVLTQPVATEAVEEALATGSFSGTAIDYLGRETVTVAASIDVGSGQWVVVGAVTTEEAYSSLQGYVYLLIVMVVVLVPLVAVVAVVISRRTLRPIGDLVEVANEVGSGTTDLSAPDFGHDEFDDVSERLNDVIGVMRVQDEELAIADAETTEILLASMPEALAEQVMAGDTPMRQEMRHATIVVVTVGDPSTIDPVGQDSLANRTVQIAGRLKEIAMERSVEVLHSSTTQYVFALGLDVEAPEANKGVAFALEVQQATGQIADELGVSITSRVGLSSGQVVQGIVGSDRIAFTVWGVPLNDATDLSMAASPGEIVVDAAVAGRLDDDWSLEPMDDLADLSGGRLDGWRVAGRAEVPQI